ncbi:MAG: carboxypeptidase-like regulatory domain-containing protein [Agriterribacter sp.]
MSDPKLASIFGLVSTIKNKPISGATIVLRNTSHETHSNRNGEYQLLSIPYGSYTSIVHKRNFKKKEVAITIVGRKLQVDVQLEKQNWFIRLFNSPLKAAAVIAFMIVAYIIGNVANLMSIFKKDTPVVVVQPPDNIRTGDLRPIPVPNPGSSAELKPLVFKPKLTFPVTDDYPKIYGLHWNFTREKGIGILIGGDGIFPNIKDLQNGAQITLAKDCGDSSAKISIFLQNDSIYFSLDLMNLQDEHHVGTIVYNHWSLFKNEYLYEYSDPNRLEIRDKQGLIMFSAYISYGEKVVDFLMIKGYFINPKSVSILAPGSGKLNNMDTCFSKSAPDWKRNAWEIVKDIETIFPEKQKL